MASRRAFLTQAGAAVSLGIAGLAGCTQSPRFVQDGTLPLYISLFQTDALREDAVSQGYNEARRLHIAQHFLTEKLKQLSTTKIQVQPRVQIASHTPPEQLFTDGDSVEAFERWKDYYEDTVPSEDKAIDANLLFVRTPKSNYDGYGEIPCDCRIRGTTGIVYGSEPLIDVHAEDVHTRKYLSQREQRLGTALHEIGHNLGFTHEMGYAWADEVERLVYATPMLGDYVWDAEYQGENYFGQEVARIDPEDGWGLHYVASYNTPLSADTILEHSDIITGGQLLD